MRYHAKAVNFGFIFRMGAKSFKQYAKSNYDINFTLDECKAILAAFFRHPDGYYAVLDYHKKQVRLLERDGFVKTPFGRLRRLPNIYSDEYFLRGQAERQAINTPTQSFDTDLGMLGMMLAHKEFSTNKKFMNKAKAIWFIHDATKFFAKEKLIVPAAKMVKTCMTERVQDYMRKHFRYEGKPLQVNYPIQADIEISSDGTWQGLEEL